MGDAAMNQVFSEGERTRRTEALRLLAVKRAQESWTYKNLKDFHNGVHECEFVSPYTKSAGNVTADIFVMLQDWASEEGLSGPVNSDTVKLGYTPDVVTDINLINLLKEHFGLMLGDVYATNLFPFIKRGGMSTAIPRKDMVRAATEFGWPQIEIICPRLVIALGLVTFSALCEVKGIERPSGLERAVSHPVDHGGARVWCQAHTGGLGVRNRGGTDNVKKDWAAMAAWYRSTAA
jgi:uracil-DNA glycosylase